MNTLDPYLEAASRENTRRSYASALRHFEEEWKGHLPATPDSVSSGTNTSATMLPHCAARRFHGVFIERLPGSPAAAGGSLEPRSLRGRRSSRRASRPGH